MGVDGPFEGVNRSLQVAEVISLENTMKLMFIRNSRRPFTSCVVSTKLVIALDYEVQKSCHLMHWKDGLKIFPASTRGPLAF